MQFQDDQSMSKPRATAWLQVARGTIWLLSSIQMIGGAIGLFAVWDWFNDRGTPTAHEILIVAGMMPFTAFPLFCVTAAIEWRWKPLCSTAERALIYGACLLPWTAFSVAILADFFF